MYRASEASPEKWSHVRKKRLRTRTGPPAKWQDAAAAAAPTLRPFKPACPSLGSALTPQAIPLAAPQHSSKALLVHTSSNSNPEDSDPASSRSLLPASGRQPSLNCQSLLTGTAYRSCPTSSEACSSLQQALRSPHEDACSSAESTSAGTYASCAVRPVLHEHHSGSISAAGGAADVAAGLHEGLPARFHTATTIQRSECEIADGLPPFSGSRAVEMPISQGGAGLQGSEHTRAEPAREERAAFSGGAIDGMRALTRQLFFGVIDAQLPVKH